LFWQILFFGKIEEVNMRTLLNKPVFANHNHKRQVKNRAIITAAILRFSETDIINGNVISHEDAIRGFQKTLGE
jgi:hypothetical protein